MPSAPEEDVRVDDANQCVWRHGKAITLSPKAWAVLRRLRQSPGQLVSKHDLLQAAWPSVYVVDVVLNNAIVQLREALGDDARRSRFIETVHRRGYRWIGPPPNAATSAVPTRFDDVANPFVGRNHALAELARYAARAAAGSRQLVFVTGEPGIGKTSLIDRFLASLPASATAPSQDGRAAGLLLGRGQCTESHGAGEPYRPVFEALEGLLRQGGADVRTTVVRFAPSWLLQMPEMMTAEELEALQRNVTTRAHERMRRELERALEAVSSDRTVVLVFDDLHWSDSATVELLWALAARREPARLMIIGSYRPVDAVVQQHPINRLRHELASKRQCVDLRLEGLDAESVGSYLSWR